MRGATSDIIADMRSTDEFQSTLLMRGATRWAIFSSHASILFQSTLLMRGATIIRVLAIRFALFQSTLLMRGATRLSRIMQRLDIFQSTLLMRGATSHTLPSSSESHISIHAPHERSDSRSCRGPARCHDFNPRSSCEERLDVSTCSIRHKKFQSTLLMRGATRGMH